MVLSVYLYVYCRFVVCYDMQLKGAMLHLFYTCIGEIPLSVMNV